MASGSRDCWVGFDLGGTKLMAVVLDRKMRVIGRVRKKTRDQSGVNLGIARVQEIIEAALADAGVSRRQLGGIGMGCPGPLDLDRGILLDSPNLGWKKVPLKSILKKKFGCPVFIANDVDAGVYGEYRLGAARGARCVVGVFPGTGIGGGCVYEGRVFRGKIGSCMEIGHCRVLPDGPLCGCGRRGCLEAVASRLAIASAAAAAACRGQAPHLLDETGLDLSDIRSRSLAASIRAGDKAVERIVRDAARWLGVGIATAVNLLAPDVIVLGGGLVDAMPGLYKEEVTAAVRRHVLPAFEKSFVVRIAKLGDDATAIGAATLVRDEKKRQRESGAGRNNGRGSWTR